MLLNWWLFLKLIKIKKCCCLINGKMAVFAFMVKYGHTKQSMYLTTLCHSNKTIRDLITDNFNKDPVGSNIRLSLSLVKSSQEQSEKVALGGRGVSLVLHWSVWMGRCYYFYKF